MAEIVFSIKRSQSANTPSALANGELGYSFSSDKLFIGQTDSADSAVTVEYIGGKLLVDKVANLESILASNLGQVHPSMTITDTATIERLVLSAFTENGILYTNITGEVKQVAGSEGQVLQVSANGVPTFGDLNGGVF